MLDNPTDERLSPSSVSAIVGTVPFPLNQHGCQVEATVPASTEIIAAAADFYRSFLWGENQSQATRYYLRRRGLHEPVLRSFGIGYSPIGWTTLLDHLADRGYGPDEVVAAGLATRSHRRDDRYYDLFRSRLMFPIARPGEPATGFAGRGTHPGPSWPRWIISPASEIFSGSTAVFGLDHATGAIRQSGEAVVMRDCLDVLDHHQRGEENRVAVIRSPLTAEHVSELKRYGRQVRRARGPRRPSSLW